MPLSNEQTITEKLLKDAIEAYKRYPYGTEELPHITGLSLLDIITRYGLEQRKQEADWFIDVRDKALMDGSYPDHAVIVEHYDEITKQLEKGK